MNLLPLMAMKNGKARCVHKLSLEKEKNPYRGVDRLEDGCDIYVAALYLTYKVNFSNPKIYNYVENFTLAPFSEGYDRMINKLQHEKDI